MYRTGVRYPRRGAAALAAVAAAAMLAGCAMEPMKPTKPPRPTPAAGLDPVAEQLHDICGSLLLFHNAYQRLPSSLEELCLATGLDRQRVTDVATGRPFAYEPDGFATSSAGAIVLLAGRPEGGDTCWGVVVAKSAKPITAKVVALPATAMRAAAAPRGGPPGPSPAATQRMQSR